MKITIIGWYGTETIGDRAILAGIFYLLGKRSESFDVQIGCLNPLLTKRTIFEDICFYKRISNNQLIGINLFDSRIKSQLDKSIRWSDVLILGGGPLMGINEMYMLKYAFQYARREKKRSIVFGCGMGPFNGSEFEKVACDIINIADYAIFRDRKSKEIYESLSGKKINTISVIDPAVFAAHYYKQENNKTGGEEEYIACNFRDATSEYKGNERSTPQFFSSELIRLSQVCDLPIKLVPMHSFDMGGDDRYFLNKIKRLSGLPNVTVFNKPTSLEETMEVYMNAKYCVGMRFHSILLQFILNGANYIYDYTNPQKGKIVNLLHQLNIEGKLDGRYMSLVTGEGSIDFAKNIDALVIDNSLISQYENNYLSIINNL